MKTFILPEEYSELESAIKDSKIKGRMPVIKIVHHISTLGLKGSKELVEKYHNGLTCVDMNLLSEFDVPQDDIALLRLTIIRDINKYKDQLSNLVKSFSDAAETISEKIHSLLDEVEDLRNTKEMFDDAEQTPSIPLLFDRGEETNEETEEDN